LNRGVFVAVEGTDGSGKSAAARELVSKLRDGRIPAVLVDAKRPSLSSPFLSERMKVHASILWENPSSEPRDLLCDAHWVHLSASWYEAVAQHAVAPALQAPQIVVVDGWFYKLLARFLLKEHHVAQLADYSYRHIMAPDLVCLLDVDPEIAASRKHEFGFSETGNFDGLQGVTRQNFIIYQSRVRESLRGLARRGDWGVVNVDRLSLDTVTERMIASVMAVTERLHSSEQAFRISQS
jgi:dTMP kinase